MKKTLLFLIAAICCLAGYADVPMRKMLEQGKTWTYVYHHFVYDSTIGNGDEFLDHETSQFTIHSYRRASIYRTERK
ncbi:MAG: hypothetical protein IJV08_00410 [Bacteroidaceae bacterium]|nr:hypothetical protein [Bacteroidaceae bacterium]